ncbi:MAG: hypothetical protein CFK49_03165 [Armatimonadetes bacterium JP3_11]|nr:MAG: hypothetical protein CFK49_03165 [Armatimonadetes bacterium JP3_11]RMH07533.1 MAG: hypothetical protein D6697_08325 [Armatimonadota bacterium]
MLQQILDRLQMGEVQSWENLSIVPLLTDTVAEPRYLLMQDALAKGLLVIEEVSVSGSVNTIKATNKATVPVLLPDSEELVGAKQNRVLNVSILLAAQTTTLIPVTCVEQGRWGTRSRLHQQALAFEASAYMLHAEARAMKARQVYRSRATSGFAHADQGAIWEEVHRKQREAAAYSPTGALHDVYQRRRHDIESYTSAFQSLPNQVGAVFAVNGEIIGAEVFDSPETFRKMFPKLLRSYALTAITSPHLDARSMRAAEVDEFLNAIANAKAESFQPVGLGVETHLNSQQVSGCALMHDGQIVHLYAFRKPERRHAREPELAEIF